MVSMMSEDSIEPTLAPTALSPYPYGLRLNLTGDDLDRLGYGELPPAGTVLRLEAVGCVTRAASEDPDADGDIDYLCVEIQIIELGMEEEAASSGVDSDSDDGQPKDQAGRAMRMYARNQ